MFNAPNLRKNSFIILLSALSLTGICLLLLSTSKWGVNVELQSTYYLFMAHLFENYAANKELLGTFLCHFQPLYPLVLSWGHFTSTNPLEAARWFNSILFGFNISLIGIITNKFTRSACMGLSAALLMLSASDILEVHLNPLSEPLFIFFMLVWLLLFFNYLKGPKLYILIFGSIIVTLASLTRFAGIPLIVTGLFAILFLNQERNLINKLFHAVIFIFIPGLSLSLYARYSYRGNDSYQRHFAFHPVDFSYLQKTASVFCGWFLSSNMHASTNVKMFLFLIMTIFCFIQLFLWYRNRKIFKNDPAKIIFVKFFVFITVFIYLYTSSLLLTASFLDADDLWREWERYLTPAHTVSLILFGGFISNFFQKASSLKNDIGKIILSYFFLSYAVGSTIFLIHHYSSEKILTNDPLRFSYTIRKIKTMPMERPIYGNDFQAVYIWGEKSSFLIPCVENPYTLKKNNKYLNQLSQMTMDLQKNKGILVYFNNHVDKCVEPMKNLQKRIPLHLVIQDQYASIFDVQ